MKYIVRAVKYFFYYCLLLCVVLAVMVLMNFTDGNIATMFKNGYDSLWQIAIMFGVVAGIYPIFGFMKRETILPGEYSQIRDTVVRHMEDKGYKLEKEEGENLSFRLRSPLNRTTRMFEDRIIFTRNDSGFIVEGIRKDVVRLISGLEYRFRQND